ncbi:MAG TPA: DUF4157 domain-containing protein, partial [Anaerolineae bacterium]|nr:DUF4157 domain-containing protein [Anaerolineae bacterium]
MRPFEQKQDQPQKVVSASLAQPDKAALEPARRQHPVLHLQRAIGNQAVQRMLQTGVEGREAGLAGSASPDIGHTISRIPTYPTTARAIQPKLQISEPGDSYEQEADRVAEEVVSSPELKLRRACSCDGGCPKCHSKPPGRKHEILRAKHVHGGDQGRAAAPLSIHEELRSPGQPLDPATRAFMEPRFGYDFSRVRVHLGGAAERSARDVNAHAYTVGQDIVFGASRFAPGTQEGRRLIAHELAHTIQQAHGAPLAIARDPKGPPFAANQQDMVYLRNTMLRFYSLLAPAERASLHRNTTVVIALVTHENAPTLVYTVASNSINPGIRAAAEQLGLLRFDPEGIDKIAGERHAEQLALEAAPKWGFKVHAMAVTREPCPDCGPVVAEKGI